MVFTEKRVQNRGRSSSATPTLLTAEARSTPASLIGKRAKHLQIYGLMELFIIPNFRKRCGVNFVRNHKRASLA